MYSGTVKRVSLSDFKPCVEITDSLDKEDNGPSIKCLHARRLSELIECINTHKKPLHDILGFRKEINGTTVDIALQWCVDDNSAIFRGYANSIYTMNGGTHIDGVKASITRTLNSLVKKSTLVEGKDIIFSEDHIMKGLACVVSVIVPKPEFEGQKLMRLRNPYVREIVDQSVEEYLTEYFELHPDVFMSIIFKSFTSYKTGLAVKRVRIMCRSESLSTSCTIGSIPEKLIISSSETSEMLGSRDPSVTPNECADAKESSLYQPKDIVSVARTSSISCENKRKREQPLSDDVVSTYPGMSLEKTNDSSFKKKNKKPKSSVLSSHLCLSARETAGSSNPPKPRDISKHTPKDVTLEPIKTRPVIPIGPGFQADIPVWIAPTKKGKFYGSPGDSDTLRWLGTGVWPTYSLKKTIHYKKVGEGRSDSCSCASPGSTNCIKQHIKEQRELLEKEIKRGFYTWKFDEMGEEAGSKSWTPKEEQRFETLVKKNPFSKRDRFWEIASNAFPKKAKKDLISYYYNVFLIKRMRLLANSPSPNRIDSDDDHNDHFRGDKDLG